MQLYGSFVTSYVNKINNAIYSYRTNFILLSLMFFASISDSIRKASNNKIDKTSTVLITDCKLRFKISLISFIQKAFATFIHLYFYILISGM